MEIVKVRRVGTSNVVTVPHIFEEFGFAPGAYVQVERQPNGDLMLRRYASQRDAVRAIAAKVVVEDHRDLEFLAAYDRGDDTSHKQRGA